MLSYWERKSFTHYDTIIIGAGLSGLFTALFLKRKYPQEQMLVIGHGLLSAAASTKNAGFACIGSITELEDDLLQKPIEQVVDLVTKRYEGLQILRTELGDSNIVYRERGSYELLENESFTERIDFWNQQLSHLGTAFATADNHQFPFNGFDCAIQNLLEGEVDTGKMYKTLKQKVQCLGVEIFTNTSVTKLDLEIEVKKVYLEGEDVQFKANRIICCTNAFTQQLLPEISIAPARAQALITKPISSLSFEGIFHFDRGYYYFREINGRVLLGGARQLDVAGETTTEFGNTPMILEDLKQKLVNNILPDQTVEVDYTWSGIMGMASKKEPIVKEVQGNTYVLAGLGGMGVALAPYLAKGLVDKI